MKEIQNNIDTLAKKVFRDFEPTPPEHVWFSIVDELPYKPQTSLLRKTLLVAATLAMLLGTSMWLYYVAYRAQSNDGQQIQASTSIPQRMVPAQAPSGAIILATDSDSPAEIIEAATTQNIEGRIRNLLEVNDRRPKMLVSISAGPPIGVEKRDSPEIRPDKQEDRQIPAKTRQQAPQDIPILAFSEPRFEVALPRSPLRVRVGSHLAMQNNFRTLSYPTSQTASFPFSQLENNIITFDAGVSVVLSSRSRFSFQTGIHYSTVGQFVNSIDIYQHPNLLPLFVQNQRFPIDHPQTVITSHGFIRLNEDRMFFSDKGSSRVITSQSLNSSARSLNLKDQGLTQVFGFIEIPIVGRFLLYDRSMDVHLKGGFAANYLVSNQVFPGEGLFQQSIGETHGIRNFNFEGIAGLVFEIPIGTNLTFHLEPTAQFFFFPIVEGFMHFGRAVPYSYSLFTGIRYGF